MTKTKKPPSDYRDNILDKVTLGGIVETLSRIPSESADLILLDPPYNLGVEYGVHHDKMTPGAYLRWCAVWLDQAAAALKPSGSLFVLISDEFVSELKIVAHAKFALDDRSGEIGTSIWRLATRSGDPNGKQDKSNRALHPRHHVIWMYTFGVNSPKKLTRSHTHILHFVKSPEKHAWYPDDPAVRIPSARQAVYNDPRANPKGRLPDDTWIYLASQLPEHPGLDVWHIPRVCGTFKEKQGTANQLPEALVARIVRLSTKPGDLVVDGFCGSGTTAAVAKKLGRHFVTCDTSPAEVAIARRRLASVKEGDPIGQAPEARKASARRSLKATKEGT